MSHLMPQDGQPLRPLSEIRDDIDSVDAELIRLLSRRADLAIEVGKTKGLDGKPFFTPERERAIFERISTLNPGPLLPKQLRSIFREIISAARAAEKPLNVSYWGPPGTFTNMAALQTFGASTEMSPQDSISDVFFAVENGKADYGVVPVENSVAGVVPETLDMFPQTNVKICSETYIPISHQLVSIASSIDQIKRVYAGPQPAAQCKRWLRMNLPSAEIIEIVPTSRAAQEALNDPQSAAIANKLGAETVGIPILQENIADNPTNRTRFLVIGYNEPMKTGRDKTSVMFNLRNRPGELYRALEAFYEHGVNLMMIESRPAPRASFEYIFYADCSGHRTDEHFVSAMVKLKAQALETTILGSYPLVESQ
jgi:chorismate mutase / prephenate dehydratase